MRGSARFLTKLLKFAVLHHHLNAVCALVPAAGKGYTRAATFILGVAALDWDARAARANSRGAPPSRLASRRDQLPRAEFIAPHTSMPICALAFS